MSLPLLYNYRRCPYAMRARLALHESETSYQIINVDFKNKPQALLEASPKGTVPVLVTTDGKVMDESLEIMYWALKRHDPRHHLPKNTSESSYFAKALGDLQNILIWAVYRIKYPERYPKNEYELARKKGQMLLQTLNANLMSQPGLVAERTTLIDMAYLPFIRQWHHVEPNDIGKEHLHHWLMHHIESDAFESIMYKHQPSITQP